MSSIEVQVLEESNTVEILEENIAVEIGIELAAPRITASPNPPDDPEIGDIWIDMSS